MKQRHILILVENNAAFYQQTENHWSNVPLYGEERNPVDNPADLNRLLGELEKRIGHSQKLAKVELVVLYAADQIALLAEWPQQMAALHSTGWQILQWEILHQRTLAIQGLANAAQAHLHTDWLCQSLLPLLEHTLGHIHTQAWQAEHERAQAAHEESMDSLRAERSQLEQHIRQLQAQIDSLHRPDMEQLLVFLPVLYRQFWNQIQPTDLALLAGSYRIPDIPSPFPEPDNHTVLQMKRKLQALPQTERQRLADFCRQLPHTLAIRPEMRFFFND